VLSGLLISVSSVVLLSYWFRYTCALILRAHPDEAAGDNQARANHLNFPDIRAKLSDCTAEVALAPLHVLVERDFRFVRFLVRNTSHSGVDSLETRMLMLDYRLMQLWYMLTLHVIHSQARKALEEMARVVGYLAQKMDSHATSFLEA
jgi:hypothetical protein